MPEDVDKLASLFSQEFHLAGEYHRLQTPAPPSTNKTKIDNEDSEGTFDSNQVCGLMHLLKWKTKESHDPHAASLYVQSGVINSCVGFSPTEACLMDMGLANILVWLEGHAEIHTMSLPCAMEAIRERMAQPKDKHPKYNRNTIALAAVAATLSRSSAGSGVIADELR